MPSIFPINKLSTDPIPFFLNSGYIELRGANYFISYFEIWKKKEYQKVYTFGTDGNTILTEDHYGKELIAVPIDTMIDLLVRVYGNLEDAENVTAKIAIRTLKAVKEELGKNNKELFCVPFFK